MDKGTLAYCAKIKIGGTIIPKKDSNERFIK